MDMKQNTKLLGWNSKYISSFQGILNICEIVISYVSVQLLKDTCRPAYSSATGGFVGSAHETYFYLSSCTCMIITCVLLFSFIISHISSIMVERTIVAFMFWSICSFLSFCTSIALFFYVNGSNSVEMFGYSHKIAAAILGFINSGFFLINAVKSYKSCKSSWSYLCKIFHNFL
ncbi:MARVEL domain-containing protein [Trichonephila clavata]|uniref:MARVEL domain-containing protein n=1 Tax=Trichonephila clavata TaxID=2740835 RepID=A0A8X6KVT6_TRICU|nr:MARVEL domain-containing protein [Trichonephila clavata]